MHNALSSGRSFVMYNESVTSGKKSVRKEDGLTFRTGVRVRVRVLTQGKIVGYHQSSG
jgi:hypothetical protein